MPGEIQQAEDRCHRIGQHTSVNIHFLLVRSSIDEIMWDTLQVRARTLRQNPPARRTSHLGAMW